ncbi:MAG: zinc-binding alcohol dehydrogenase family protein [Planctomycetota bacterium]
MTVISGTVTTEAWVLRRGEGANCGPGALELGEVSFDEPTDEELLVEPIYGCWEANMTHAVERDPVDICQVRGEEQIVLGNAGVVRVLRPGRAVTDFEEGEIAIVVPIGKWDEAGHTIKVLGYDARGTYGMLAKRIKLHRKQLLHIPPDDQHSYRQWAAFPIRYATAWANWKVAYGCWQQQFGNEGKPIVWGWGGGMSLGELILAKRDGCRAAMIASTDERLALIESCGLEAIDRRPFADLSFDAERFATDRAYKRRYIRAERTFMNTVLERTDGAKVSIFIDAIGGPVFRATQRALARRGVITTAGWRRGMMLTLARANECISHNLYVHTHGCPLDQGAVSVEYASRTGWVPPVDDRVYSWEEVPLLADDFAAGRISTYFPVYQVNPL